MAHDSRTDIGGASARDALFIANLKAALAHALAEAEGLLTKAIDEAPFPAPKDLRGYSRRQAQCALETYRSDVRLRVQVAIRKLARDRAGVQFGPDALSLDLPRGRVAVIDTELLDEVERELEKP